MIWDTPGVSPGRIISGQEKLHNPDNFGAEFDEVSATVIKAISAGRNAFQTYEARAKGSEPILKTRVALTKAQEELFYLQGEISREAEKYQGLRNADFEQLMKYGQEVNAKITEVSNALYNLQRIESGMAIDLDGNALSIRTRERLPAQYKVPEPPAVKPSDMPAWAKGMPTPTPPKSFWGKVKRFFSY